MVVLEIETSYGVARAHVEPVADAVAAMVLGHGAGGSVTARDLLAVAGVAREAGIVVARVEQPYRVAGRRSPPRAEKLDLAWSAVVDELLAGPLRELPLIAGGRSSGARVACRTADATGAIGVVCLAFPLIPPQREGSTATPTRQPELDAVRVPTLVVQGQGDRFGMPAPSSTRQVIAVRGDHGLKSDLPGVAGAVRGWLPGLVAGVASAARSTRPRTVNEASVKPDALLSETDGTLRTVLGAAHANRRRSPP